MCSGGFLIYLCFFLCYIIHSCNILRKLVIKTRFTTTRNFPERGTMSTYHILYNRLSRSNTGELEAHMLDEIMSGETLKYHNVAEIEDYHRFFADIPADDKIIVAGGDGTMNRFINDTDYCHVPQEVYFFPAGSGNDFARDIGKPKHCEPFEIRKFISNLPAISTGGIFVPAFVSPIEKVITS